MNRNRKEIQTYKLAQKEKLDEIKQKTTKEVSRLKIAIALLRKKPDQFITENNKSKVSQQLHSNISKPKRSNNSIKDIQKTNTSNKFNTQTNIELTQKIRKQLFLLY